jgi:phosphoglycerate dehydrogenase-like enzyme
MRKVLVTDTLFIFPEHEAKLRDAGFEIVRMSGTMNETELISAIRDKEAYILGGIEKVTEPVVAAANSLKIIAYTGADPWAYIPAYDLATSRGIKVTATPGSTTFAVSELTITLMLSMLRHVFEIGGPGNETFIVSQSLEDVRVGVVGMGRIGERVSRLLIALGVKEVWYWNRTRKEQLEHELGVSYKSLEELFAGCNVLSNHLSTEAGQLISRDLLERTQDGALFINAGSDSFDMDSLYERITKHGARAAFDMGAPVDDKFKSLPLSSWYKTNEVAGYLTHGSLKLASDMATQSVINVCNTGSDEHVVN